MVRRTVLIVLLFFSLSTAVNAEKNEISSASYGVIDEEIAKISYQGDEYFEYDISWTGGIKIGEMYQELKRSKRCTDCFEIHSTITTSGGIIHLLYPVRDTHITHIKGRQRLPYFSEIWQKEGKSYRAHKKVSYDQKNYTLTKEKSGDPPRVFQLNGVVHNEFSSFFSSRVMDLSVGKKLIVPTFGDDMRREVVVNVTGTEVRTGTLLGDVDTVRVTPLLTFSGLYDKTGDTIIWYTNDECRVPVEIRSKIIIGSLTAKLTDYRNPYCHRYTSLQSRK